MDSQVAVALALSLVGGVSTSIGTQFHLHSFNIVISFSIGYLFIYLCQFQLLMKAYHQLFICYRFVFWIIVFPFSFCVCRCETGALFVIVNKTPSLKMLGLLQVVLVGQEFYLFIYFNLWECIDSVRIILSLSLFSQMWWNVFYLLVCFAWSILFSETISLYEGFCCWFDA